MKKLLIALSLSIFTFSASAFASFSDTNNYKWRLSIEYLQEEGIVVGYENGTFGPYNNINRAEFMKLVMEGFYTVNESDSYACFDDIVGDEWYAKYVCMAKDLGIVSGRPDGTFDPSAEITQPEALRVIFNALEQDVINEGGEWYQQYLDHAERIGMFYFNVTSPAAYNVTRGETSYFIAWLTSPQPIEHIKAEDFYANNPNPYYDLIEENLGE